MFCVYGYYQKKSDKHTVEILNLSVQHVLNIFSSHTLKIIKLFYIYPIKIYLMENVSFLYGMHRIIGETSY